MSILGRRDSEPPAEEAHEGQAGADQSQAEAHDTPEPVTEHQAGESAPAFWRAQGETPAPLERDPADAPPAYGQVPPAGSSAAPAPAVNQAPTATDAAQPAVAEAEQSAVAPNWGTTPQRWSEILVSFVDDPRGSVKTAADAVDNAIGEFVNSVRARQRALASSWQGTDTDTEQLRTALRDYRRLWHQVQQLDLGEKTGA